MPAVRQRFASCSAARNRARLTSDIALRTWKYFEDNLLEGNHYLIPNSNNMEHEIKPIVEYYDKSKNGSCISCQRKIIEQQRKYLEKFDSETVKKRYKIQLN